ncbi:putative fructoselysine utilization operon transcriptional repressor [bioreactor metagenome]|uniref:Putative fructoselysine utilization operon transcriptional repressor n=1 Tax=bioreactor metagenome TaxID=1076179 RepID=A0A645F5G2_9ZZZZ
MQIELNSPVVYIERLIWEDLAPTGIDRLYVSESLYPDIITKLSSDRSLYQTLKDEYHVNSESAVLEINGIVADIKHSELLECSVGEPLFIVEKISYESSGKPIHYSSSIVRCDRITYVISITDHVNVDEKKEN